MVQLREPAVAATPLLAQFSTLGVIEWADVHPALHLCHLYGETDDRVRLAVALTIRAMRSGSLCLDLQRARELAWTPTADADEGRVAVPEDAWPDPEAWRAAVTASPAVTVDADGAGLRPVRLVGSLLYLERNWADQEQVRQHVLARLAVTSHEAAPELDEADLAPEQAAALRAALTRGLTVIAGGPGTGKTRVIARIVAALRAAPSQPLVALAAPTGKAAARMTESLVADGLAGQPASTIHRLLGWCHDSRAGSQYNARNPLPHDVVIIDELSMVSMALMARLLDAIKPTARVILVGDPDQLASVEAGAVLADLTQAAPVQDAVVRLTRNFRFAGPLQQLADAVRLGDAEAALRVLDRGDPGVVLASPEAGEALVRRRLVDTGRRVVEAAAAGDAAAALSALGSHRLLCAHRRGRFGVGEWTARATDWLRRDVPAFQPDEEFYVGRPLLVTGNAPDLGLFNGDTGVVVRRGDTVTAVFDTAGSQRQLSPYVLDGLASVHAMTIHKSQGSQFSRVSVVLPDADSPLLTRQLLYTAITRAQDDVLIVGSRESLVAAIETPAARTSGLVERLGG